MSDTTEDRLQIIDVLVRYATGIDQKDWELFRTCFTSDVTADYGPYGQWTDVEALTAFMVANHQDMRATKHLLTNFVVDVRGDAGTAQSYVHAVLVFDDVRWIDAVGHYDDELVRTPEGWRIRRRRGFVTRTLTSGVQG